MQVYTNNPIYAGEYNFSLNCYLGNVSQNYFFSTTFTVQILSNLTDNNSTNTTSLSNNTQDNST